jgi:AcrR family transcriptional regulator
MSAEERRAAVLAAAVTEFGKAGLAGTSTETIAARAGISQPYLFRLFPTKQALFLAAVGRCFDRVLARFDRASEGLVGHAALDAMGLAYGDLVEDRELLLLQLQAYAASSVPEIREFVRDRYVGLVGFVAERSRAEPDAVRQCIAMGMLWNVVAALGLEKVGELWCAPGDPVAPSANTPPPAPSGAGD